MYYFVNENSVIKNLILNYKERISKKLILIKKS